MKSMLVILAHPDDESFGPGGTLAKYARAGVAVHYLCGTRGESGTVDAAKLNGFKDTAELRTAELMCAASELKLASVDFTGYRDSGMVGTADNTNVDSLHSAPLDDVAARILERINKLKPDVIITHDQYGGYGHPDHIKLHHATLRAYEIKYGLKIDLSNWNADTKTPGVVVSNVARNETYRGNHDVAPVLVFTTFPKGLMRWAARLLPLFGQNPRKFGRNKDINILQIAEWDLPTTTIIDTRETTEVKERASSCHASQQIPARGGNPIVRLFFRRAAGKEFFSQVYPAVQAGSRLKADF